MDASELKVGDAFDRVCSDPLCHAGMHREVVVGVNGGRLKIVREKHPYKAIEAEVRGSELWAINGPHLEIADIYKGEGTNQVAQYELYEALVMDSRNHQIDDIGFEMIGESNRDDVQAAIALMRDPRVSKLSGSVYGALKLAGIEPSEKLIIIMVALLQDANNNGAMGSVVGLLGSLIGTDIP